MGHKTLIGGTSYEIKGGKTMIDGTVYSITKGRTLIDGTGYDISFSNVSPVFGDNSWETIRTESDAGTASTLWSIGDKKPITFTTGQVVNAVIADFGHDLDVNGNTIGITLILEDCLNTTYQINSTNTNVGSFTGSTMYVQLNSDVGGNIKATIPPDLKAVVKLAKKKTSAGNQSATIQTDNIMFWLLSEVEAFGTIYGSYAGEGSQYSIFTSSTSRIKKINNTAGIWWLRSPRSVISTQFCGVSLNGGVSTDNASALHGVAFGFCV